MRAHLGLFLLTVAACGGTEANPDPAVADPYVPPGPGEYVFDPPPEGLATPVAPLDNPTTKPKVELGRHLFYDLRMSKNQTQSCVSCHPQSKGFASTLPQAVGSTGMVLRHNPISLVNVGLRPSITWSSPGTTALEVVPDVSLFDTGQVELAMTGEEDLLLSRVRAEHRYQLLFPLAFPGEPEPITVLNLERAIAAFVRTIVSKETAYDRYVAGDQDALNPSAKRGFNLFFGEHLGCYRCHGGPLFNQTIQDNAQPTEIPLLHNTGLYNIGGRYPESDPGLESTTGDPLDNGKFRAPSLRNVALTAPYFHDGSAATLQDVLDHYARGGRLLTTGPNAGDGRENPLKDPRIAGFRLTAEQVMDRTEDIWRYDLIEFLKSLTDDSVTTDPRYGNPW